VLPLRLSRYFVILSALWIVALTWRIYPQFPDTLRVDGRLMTLDEYVEESCGQRVGPAAASCLSQARDTGRLLVAREQGKFVLFIMAPLLICLPVSVVVAALDRRRSRPAADEAVAD
jgi:hypothetical protein